MWARASVCCWGMMSACRIVVDVEGWWWWKLLFAAGVRGTTPAPLPSRERRRSCSRYCTWQCHGKMQ